MEDWLKQFETVMNNPTVSSIAQSYLGNKKSSSPPEVVQAPTSVYPQAPINTPSLMSNQNIIYVLIGVVVLGALYFVMKKKKG